jgi:NarL family two-component system response regulator LiaR
MFEEGPRLSREAGLGNGQLRVLVVELDGGAAATALRGAADVSVETTRTFDGVAESLRSTRPQAVVVGLGAPRPGDALSLKQLVASTLPAPVMLLSQPVDENAAIELLKAGISGYLFTSDVRFLLTSVRELLRGGLPMSGPLSQLVLQRARRSSSKLAAVRPQSAAAQGLLSARQREILTLLQGGHSYDDIATALDLSVNTIRSHVRVVYERLGASSKVEAVMVGLALGLLERPRLA